MNKQRNIVVLDFIVTELITNMTLYIKDESISELTLSTVLGLTKLSFSRQVNASLLHLDPFWSHCTIQHCSTCGDSVDYILLPHQVHCIEITASNIKITITGNHTPHRTFTVRTIGARNAVVFRDNTFAGLHLLDTGQHTKFDLAHQASLPLHMDTCSSTKVLFARTSGPLCSICYGSEATRFFQPCGHWGVCADCATRSAQQLTQKCAICRTDTQQILPLYVV